MTDAAQQTCEEARRWSQGRLEKGSRSAALELKKEAVRFDGNRGLIIESILEIERERSHGCPRRRDRRTTRSIRGHPGKE